jgi:hypothetical protein
MILDLPCGCILEMLQTTYTRVKLFKVQGLRFRVQGLRPSEPGTFNGKS